MELLNDAKEKVNDAVLILCDLIASNQLGQQSLEKVQALVYELDHYDRVFDQIIEHVEDQ